MLHISIEPKLFRRRVPADDRLTPHRYVSLRRVDRAQQWLTDANCALELRIDVASKPESIHRLPPDTGSAREAGPSVCPIAHFGPDG
jgi:hypothetical protein